MVTGASRGIGRAVALRLARQGADLIITGRTAEDLASLAQDLREIGRKVLVAEGDATKEQDVADSVRSAKEMFGKIDILVNNVGIGAYRPFTDTTVDDYDTMVGANVRSTFLYTRFVVDAMIEHHYGQIITIASQSGKIGYAGEAPYCASKFAQMGMMESLDRELLQHNIKVAVVCPGSVNTDFAIGAGRKKGDPTLAQMLDAEDVAEAVNFIAAQPWKCMIMEISLRPATEARY